MRIVVQQLAIFLLPILLYAAYLMWRRWRARVAGNPEPPWEQGQWFWAIVVGLVLSIGVFVVLAIFGDGSPDAIFRPPSWQR
jgi:MFS superfamily sulfate permease-like transporter